MGRASSATLDNPTSRPQCIHRSLKHLDTLYACRQQNEAWRGFPGIYPDLSGYFFLSSTVVKLLDKEWASL